MKYRYHPDHTLPDNPAAVFVFGSNLAARHGGGAALVAARQFGASPDVAEGMGGRSYAIPTKDEDIRTMPLDDIETFVQEFVYFARNMPRTEFFMTRVGCVLAGYSDEQIAPMFKGCSQNVVFPEQWAEWLEEN